MLRFRIHFTLFIFLVANACSLVDTTPAPDTQKYYPLDTRTGIPEVDSTLSAIESRDLQNLRALINYTVAPCTTADGLGGPPKCREGEINGTQVEALPFIGGEGSFIRKDEIGNWPGINANAVYAIYRVSENSQIEQYYPSGEYAILLSTPENQPAISIRIGNDGIVRIDYIFDPSPESLIMIMEQDSAEVILAPKTR